MAPGLRSPGPVHRTRRGLVDVPLVTTDVHRRGHRRRARRRRPPRTRAINVQSEARTYFREMTDLINEVVRDINNNIIPLLPKAVEEADVVLSQDAAEDDIDGFFEQMKEKYRRPQLLLEFERRARDVAESTSRLHRNQTESQMKSLGIDLFRESPRLAQLLDRFTRRNTDLIRTIPQELIAGVEKTVKAGIANGLRHEDIAKQVLSANKPAINATAGQVRKARNRAALIARDQVLTASQQLSKARQQANGITRFIWRTVGDDRVRDLHEPREGVEYSWATGAPGGDPFPGSGINCRCWSEPVL